MPHWGPQPPDHRLVPVRNWAEHQEVRGGQAGETSSVFAATPHLSHYLLNSAPVRSVAALDPHSAADPTVNCTYDRSRLSAPYENHSETIPSPSLLHGNIVFLETRPWYQKGWRLLCYMICIAVCIYMDVYVHTYMHMRICVCMYLGLPQWLREKESACNSGDTSPIPG